MAENAGPKHDAEGSVLVRRQGGSDATCHYGEARCIAEVAVGRPDGNGACTADTDTATRTRCALP